MYMFLLIKFYQKLAIVEQRVCFLNWFADLLTILHKRYSWFTRNILELFLWLKKLQSVPNSLSVYQYDTPFRSESTYAVSN